MGFDDLPAQPPLFPPEAEHYAQKALELSRVAARRCDGVFDIAYGDHRSQRLDVYRPKNAITQPLPVLVFAHGGAWTNGYKEWLGLLAPAITATPAVLVTVTYRLAPNFRYPHPFKDCILALSWVNRNIESHGGDPRRVFVGGHSSGGTLFALAALRRDARSEAGLPGDAIAGCMPLSARFDLALHDVEHGTTEARHKSMLFEENADMPAFSPLHNVSGNQIPFLIAHGSNDIPALCNQASAMVDILRNEGAYVEHLVLKNYDHFDTAIRLADPDDPWTIAVRRWLRTEPEAFTSASR